MIIETLRQSRNGGNVNIEEVASRARTSTSFANRLLHEILGLAEPSAIELSPKTRIQLAFQAANQGRLREVARALTWQEFEKFAEECLVSAGFQTLRGLVINGEGRRWQIDLVARRGQMILVFDCKHWNSPSHPSKFREACHHQKLATRILIHDLETKGLSSTEKIRALPIILTLLDPRAQLSDDVVLVSFEKLPDFLNGITAYSELPFMSD